MRVHSFYYTQRDAQHSQQHTNMANIKFFAYAVEEAREKRGVQSIVINP